MNNHKTSQSYDFPYFLMTGYLGDHPGKGLDLVEVNYPYTRWVSRSCAVTYTNNRGRVGLEGGRMYVCYGVEKVMGLTGFVIIHVFIASFSPAQGARNQMVNTKFTRPVNEMPMSSREGHAMLEVFYTAKCFPWREISSCTGLG